MVREIETYNTLVVNRFLKIWLEFRESEMGIGSSVVVFVNTPLASSLIHTNT